MKEFLSKKRSCHIDSCNMADHLEGISGTKNLTAEVVVPDYECKVHEDNSGKYRVVQTSMHTARALTIEQSRKWFDHLLQSCVTT